MAAEGKEKVLAGFANSFGNAEGARVFFAPGRVNLIGEHTDYNGGHVFPCALDIGCYAAVRKREDRILRFASVNIPKAGITEVSIDDLDTARTGKWADYPKGVVWAFEGRGYKLDSGFDMAIYGDIPNGAGLSSSAALEVVTGFALRALYGFDTVTNQDLAFIGQYSENNYNGMNCGIMDQFASAMGKENNAIFLDTNTMVYEYAPVKLDGMKLVITNTNKKELRKWPTRLMPKSAFPADAARRPARPKRFPKVRPTRSIPTSASTAARARVPARTRRSALHD